MNITSVTTEVLLLSHRTGHCTCRTCRAGIVWHIRTSTFGHTSLYLIQTVLFYFGCLFGLEFPLPDNRSDTWYTFSVLMTIQFIVLTYFTATFIILKYQRIGLIGEMNSISVVMSTIIEKSLLI